MLFVLSRRRLSSLSRSVLDVLATTYSGKAGEVDPLSVDRMIFRYASLRAALCFLGPAGKFRSPNPDNGEVAALASMRSFDDL